MSYSDWAAEQKNVPADARAVLILLALRADEGATSLSLRQLANRAGMSDVYVIEQLLLLEDNDLLDLNRDNEGHFTFGLRRAA